jgi:hypothetical protein
MVDQVTGWDGHDYADRRFKASGGSFLQGAVLRATPTIRIEVALPPAVVLEQLARYGKDWHESRLPAEVKGASVWLRVQGTGVELELAHYRGPDVVWRGSVVEAGAGSVITLGADHEHMGPIAWLTLILAFTGFAVLRYGLKSALVLLPFALVLVLLLDRLVWPRRAKSEAPLCRAILLRATQALPPSSSDSHVP